MNIFKELTKILNEKKPNVKYICVFAPTGLWQEGKDKDEWLKALAETKADRKFLFGNTPPKITNKRIKDLIQKRLWRLVHSGVKIRKMPPQTCRWPGFVIIDDICILPEKDGNLIVTSSKEYLCLLKEGGFNKLWRKMKKYEMQF